MRLARLGMSEQCLKVVGCRGLGGWLGHAAACKRGKAELAQIIIAKESN